MIIIFVLFLEKRLLSDVSMAVAPVPIAGGRGYLIMSR